MITTLLIDDDQNEITGTKVVLNLPIQYIENKG